MWEEKEGKKLLRVNEVDVLIGVVIGLGGSRGCTKLKLRRAMSWMTPLQITLVKSIQRGLIKEVGNRYMVRMEEASAVGDGKPKHSAQLPPQNKLLGDVHDIYAIN